LVTGRLPHDELYTDLNARQPEWGKAGISSVQAIGDAWAPATIAAAVWAGRRYAEEFDSPVLDEPVPFRREMTSLAAEPHTG